MSMFSRLWPATRAGRSSQQQRQPEAAPSGPGSPAGEGEQIPAGTKPDERRISVAGATDGQNRIGAFGSGGGEGNATKCTADETGARAASSAPSVSKTQAATQTAIPAPACDGGWQHAAAHTVAAVVGAALLSLPYALRWLGLAWGVALLMVACVVSHYTSYVLVLLGSETAGENDDKGAAPPPTVTYRDIGRRVFGPRAGLWLIAPFQFTVLIGTAAVHMNLGGQSLSSIYATACEIPPDGSAPGLCPPLPQWAGALLFTFLCLLVAPRPGLHEVSWVSFLAAIMSLTYGTMAVVTSGINLLQPQMAEVCEHSAASTDQAANPLLESFNAIGIIIFCYGGHSVLPEIQATIKPDPTTVRPMMKGRTAAYVPVTAIYFVLAVVGYLAFGECTHPNVLLSNSGSDSAAGDIAAAADLLVAVHMFGSVQVYSQPVMQALQGIVAGLLSSAGGGTVSSPVALRYTVNLTYMAALGALAAAIPGPSAAIGLVGGLAITWMTFVVPSVMFIVMHGKTCSWSTLAINVLILCVCSTLGLLATAGAGYRFWVHFFGPSSS